MAFISLSNKVYEKSFTGVENAFITKYLPVLEPIAVKVYLYALYLCRSGINNYTVTDLAKSVNITDEEAINYFEYLEEFELVNIISQSPFEVEICNSDNVSGTPKKFKPEKYSDFTKNAQQIIKGRMISTNEFREYFYLLEEYGFEQNALLMIISYCVNLKGEDIRFQYIKKVAKSFADEGLITEDKVSDKLSAYTSYTPSIIKIFSAIGINRQPDIEDDKYYKKWNDGLKFSDEAIIAAAKHFKVKTSDKIDRALDELYKNKKFDVKEIADYCKSKNSVYELTFELARSLGVYMQTAAPYVENYVNVWCNDGFSFESLRLIAKFCFLNSKNSFDGMNGFILELLNEGVVDDESVKTKLENLQADDKQLGELISACGLSRKVIPWDRENLARWRSWGFSGEILKNAAILASGKSNPMAYMNGILSAWKASGIYSVDKLPTASAKQSATTWDKAAIESHYSELRHRAEERADNTLATALKDEIYADIHKQLNSLAIKLAFAEVNDIGKASELSNEIARLEKSGDERLTLLGINSQSFIPQYACKICNDTGYDKNGKPCVCLKKLIGEI